MPLQQISVDQATLPGEMLADAKAHMRVEHTRDDAAITRYVAAAINWVEKATGLSVFASVWEWEVSTYDCALQVPKAPATRVYQDTTDLETTYDGIEQYLVERPSGTVSIDAGFAAYADMPPNLVQAVLESAASYYETREDVSYSRSYEAPMAASRLLTGLWRPTA